jgi:hypothetical protein
MRGGPSKENIENTNNYTKLAPLGQTGDGTAGNPI